MSARCVRGYVSGRVQGVGFRDFTRRKAVAAHVSGWARNLADGRVEVLLCGDNDAVEQVIAAIHRGPSHAEVTAVELTDQPLQALTGFQIG